MPISLYKTHEIASNKIYWLINFFKIEKRKTKILYFKSLLASLTSKTLMGF